jgi:hypothetical protein
MNPLGGGIQPELAVHEPQGLVGELGSRDGGYPGEGNIDVEPRFVSFRGFDYLLAPGSPCIDTGDPALEDGISDWHPRWPAWYDNGVRSDQGAYGGPGNSRWVRY